MVQGKFECTLEITGPLSFQDTKPMPLASYVSIDPFGSFLVYFTHFNPFSKRSA